MLAAGSRQFARNEGLYTEAHSIQARADPSIGAFLGHIARCHLDGRLPPGPAGYCLQDSIEIGRDHAAGSATAKVNSLGLPWPILSRDFGAERRQVIPLQLSRKHA